MSRRPLSEASHVHLLPLPHRPREVVLVPPGAPAVWIELAVMESSHRETPHRCRGLWIAHNRHLNAWQRLKFQGGFS